MIVMTGESVRGCVGAQLAEDCFDFRSWCFFSVSVVEEAMKDPAAAGTESLRNIGPSRPRRRNCGCL